MNIFCRQFKSPLFDRIYFVLCRILKATQPARKIVSKSWWNESSCFRERIHLNQMFSNWASQVHSLRNFLSIIFIFYLKNNLKKNSSKLLEYMKLVAYLPNSMNKIKMPRLCNHVVMKCAISILFLCLNLKCKTFGNYLYQDSICSNHFTFFH